LTPLARGDTFLGSFSGQLSDGFSNLVITPTGFRAEFVTEPCIPGPDICQQLFPSLPEYTTLPGLFESAGLILPSSSPQVFTASDSDVNFNALTTILTSSSIASASQLFFCDEASTPLLTCPYDHGPWAGIPPSGTQFEFPNATIDSITLTVSPFAWVQDSNGDWWMRQPDGSFAAVTVSAYGEVGFGSPPLPPPPTSIPEPGPLIVVSISMSGLLGSKLRRRFGCRQPR
jgi:hypothetical protein